MSDLLQRIRTEIDERLATSRAAVEEMERLEAALRALEGIPGLASQASGSARPRAERARSGAARPRAPRGVNRAAVLAAIGERPGASAGEIASASGVSSNAVYGQLRRLVAEGLLVKRELPGGGSGYAPARPAEPSPPAAATPPSPSPDTTDTEPKQPDAAEAATVEHDAGPADDAPPPGTSTGEE